MGESVYILDIHFENELQVISFCQHLIAYKVTPCLEKKGFTELSLSKHKIYTGSLLEVLA